MGRVIAAVTPVISRADVSAHAWIFVVGRGFDRRVYALEQMSGAVVTFRSRPLTITMSAVVVAVGG
jgi:hypothetical protein